MNDPERARRVGLNEALFREINERLEALTRGASTQQGSLHLVCESGDRDCAERIILTITDSTQLCSDPLLFGVRRAVGRGI